MIEGGNLRKWASGEQAVSLGGFWGKANLEKLPEKTREKVGEKDMTLTKSTGPPPRESSVLMKKKGRTSREKTKTTVACGAE